MPPRFRTPVICLFGEGGVDNFCLRGRQITLFWVPICISGTHGRHFGRFGPVASSDLPIWQRPAHFSSTPPRICRLRAAHFVRSHIDALNLRLCGLGVDNFASDQPFLGPKWAHFASLELTTGPAQTRISINSHDLKATSTISRTHTTFQKLQTCNSHKLTGQTTHLWKTVGKKAGKGPPFARFLEHATEGIWRDPKWLNSTSAYFWAARFWAKAPDFGSILEFGPLQLWASWDRC